MTQPIGKPWLLLAFSDCNVTLFGKLAKTLSSLTNRPSARRNWTIEYGNPQPAESATGQTINHRITGIGFRLVEFAGTGQINLPAKKLCRISVGASLDEAQTIGNRWEHAPAEGLRDDMCYRDIDTIERLLQAFGADSQTLCHVKQEKQHLLSRLASTKNPSVEVQMEPITANSGYKPGDMVRLKADPTKTGAITAALGEEAENRYQV